MGTVETKEVGRGPFKGHPIKLEAVAKCVCGGGPVCSHPMEQAPALSFVKSRVDRICKTLAEFIPVRIGTGHGQAVNDQFQSVGNGGFFGCFSSHIGQREGTAVCPEAGKPLLLPDVQLVL